MPSQIGLIGLGLMGENLALNLEDKGYAVSLFDVAREKVERFTSGRGRGKKILGCRSLQELIGSLELPRKIMLMVPAGKPVDEIIEQLIEFLDEGDIVIDGGNSHFSDTNRRVRMLEGKGLLYVGAGVSGGEEGALLGPSIMPGGSFAAWKSVGPIFQAIAAKVDDGTPCCDWIGKEGAGHFVKMVHNGIEYGDMQLICEAYDVMKSLLGMPAAEMYEVFKEWGDGELKGYLIEITRDILAIRDEDGMPLLDKILDKAGQKGTGKWAVVTSLDMGVPLTLVAESVFARVLSSLKDERLLASRILTGPTAKFRGNKKAFIKELGKALYAAKVISYTQGYQLMRAAEKEFGWKLNYGSVALMWRGGCIIRSALLEKIKEAFDSNPELVNILHDRFFRESIVQTQQSLRNVLGEAIKNGIPMPAMSAALAYYDGYRSERLPANLLQAQRDYFGAHQYERVDMPPGKYFHFDWSGRGGATASSIYSA